MADEIKEIKGYQLQDLLGEGGFGSVYRAYQPLIKREVAIKVINKNYASKPEFIRRFEAEAQLVARLEHIHIVPLYDYWRDPSGAYLVMRLLRGGSLRDELIKRGRFEIEEVETIVSQMGSALTLAHRNGVIHRDLKPANILIDEEKNTYLTDFGIAKDAGQEDEDDMAVIGTPAYSPPEQLQSDIPTQRSDIYSFGLIIYELITGQQAVLGETLTDIMMKQLNDSIPLIDPDMYGIPMVLNDVLLNATAKDPEERYESVSVFVNDFKKALRNTRPRPAANVGESNLDDMIVFSDATISFSLTDDDLHPTPLPSMVVNPYKGLRAFQEGDADDFFGREALTQKLLARLDEDSANARFLAVVGPSGSGKSSVVKAGVIPAIRRGHVPNADKYFIAEMVPGVDALDELEIVLLSIAASPPENMRERLQSSETGLFELLQEILPKDGSQLFLLIDQFEEIFTQTNDNRVRTHFMNSLQYAINHPESNLWAVITIRADFYDKPLLYPQFGELVRERTEVVLPLSRAELESAIAQPARNMGVQLEPALVESIISDVQEEPGALPLLQYALTELFDRRDGMTMRLSTYRESGGVLGSLARRAEELYVEMDNPHQESLRQLFLRLVTLGEGTEDTRRRVLWSELAFTGAEKDPLVDVLDAFTRYRLLTRDNDPQTREPTVEVAHEALIRQWTRLREWLAANRDNIRTQRQVAVALQEWHASKKDKSFLATGMRLSQFELLLNNSDIALTSEERAYVESSIEQRQAVIREEEERVARERALEERASRFLRVLAAVMTIGGLVAGALAVFAFFQRQEAVTARDAAVVAQAAAEREAAVNNSVGLSNRARLLGRTGEVPLLGIGYAIEANTISNPPVEVQQTLAELVWQPGARRQLVGHLGQLWGVAYGADGRSVFSGGGAFDGSDNRLIEWDVVTGAQIRVVGEQADRIYSVATSPDGRYIATGSQDTTVIIWDVATGEQLHVLSGHTAPIFNVLFTPDSTQLISAGADAVMVWDVASGQRVNRFAGIHADHILDMDINDAGTLIFSGSFDGSIALWELATGEVLNSFRAGQITGARFLPDESGGVTSDQDGKLIFWNFEQNAAIRTVTHPFALRGGVAITPDGQRAVTADDQGNLMVYAVQGTSNEPLLSFSGHDSRVTSLDLSPDGSFVATSSFDFTLIVWDLLGRSAENQRLAGRIATLSADGTQIASLQQGQVTITDAQTGTVSQTWAVETSLNQLAFSPDGTQIAGAGDDGTVIVWTVTGDLVQTYQGHRAPVRAIAFSPDGTQIAGAGGQVQVSETRPADNTIIIWDVASGDVVHTLDEHEGAVRALAFTPDGTGLLSASDDTQIILWNVATGAEIRRYSGHSDAVWSLAFNADGSQFLSGSRDTSIILWNTSGAQVRQLRQHNSGVRALAFSPDGVHALSGAGDVVTNSGVASDYAMLYWDVQTGDMLRRYPGHTQTIRSIAFNADGTQAISASDDGNVIQWYVDDLQGLMARVGATYDVFCTPNATNTICKPDPRAVADSTATTETVTQGFPSQSGTIALYLDGSLCRVPNDGAGLPIEPVDTTAFALATPYVIGYSNGGVENTPADWIAAWAQYRASETTSIGEFVVRDAGGSATQQITDLEEMIALGVNAIIINPVEQSNNADLIAVLESARAANIAVVMVGHYVADAPFVSYVGQDDFEVGCIMSQELISLVDGEGGVARLHAVDLSTADVRFKLGEGAVFSLYPGMNPIAEGPTSYSRTSAATYTSSVSVLGILGYNSEIALGGQDGVRQQGLPYVPVVSDHSIELAQFMVDNQVEGVLVRASTDMGARAVDVAVQILQGESVMQFERIEPTLISVQDLLSYNFENAPANGYLGDWEMLPSEYYPE